MLIKRMSWRQVDRPHNVMGRGEVSELEGIEADQPFVEHVLFIFQVILEDHKKLLLLGEDRVVSERVVALGGQIPGGAD